MIFTRALIQLKSIAIPLPTLLWYPILDVKRKPRSPRETEIESQTSRDMTSFFSTCFRRRIMLICRTQTWVEIKKEDDSNVGRVIGCEKLFLPYNNNCMQFGFMERVKWSNWLTYFLFVGLFDTRGMHMIMYYYA